MIGCVVCPLTTTRWQCKVTFVCNISADPAKWEMQHLWSDHSLNLMYSIQCKQSDDIESKQNTVKVNSLWSGYE